MTGKDSQLDNLIELDSLIIQVYWELDKAVEQYLSIGCDLGVNGVNPDCYFRDLAQHLGNESIFLCHEQDSDDLIRIIQQTSEGIMKAPSAGLKTYNAAKVSTYKAHVEVESRIYTYYRFDLYIHRFEDLLETYKEFESFLTPETQQKDFLMLASQYQYAILREIQEGKKELFLDVIPATRGLCCAFTNAHDVLRDMQLDNLAIKKIHRLIGLLIESISDFLENHIEPDTTTKTQPRENTLVIDGADLTDTEKNILEALANDTLTGAELLKKAGYGNTSHYRTILSNLCKRGILGNNGKGYFKT